mmetsp:Transcript_1403/g.2968  ORF Transcript_1403/g.2968 Transcript_1403/m.2968 type:complete len:327 (-) Transcript_1403:169-1149(-)
MLDQLVVLGPHRLETRRLEHGRNLAIEPFFELVRKDLLPFVRVVLIFGHFDCYFAVTCRLTGLQAGGEVGQAKPSSQVHPRHELLLVRAPGGLARNSEGHDADGGASSEVLERLDRVVVLGDLLREHWTVRLLVALGVGHREVLNTLNVEGAGRRPQERVHADGNVLWVVANEERRPFVDTPQPLKILPREQNDHPVALLQEVLDHIHTNHQQLVLLRDAGFVNPERELVPPFVLVHAELFRQVSRDHGKLSGLERAIVGVLAHVLHPVLRRGPRVCDEAGCVRDILRQCVVSKFSTVGGPELGGSRKRFRLTPLGAHAPRWHTAH